jgi:hypothetical protein
VVWKNFKASKMSYVLGWDDFTVYKYFEIFVINISTVRLSDSMVALLWQKYIVFTMYKFA